METETNDFNKLIDTDERKSLASAAKNAILDTISGELQSNLSFFYLNPTAILNKNDAKYRIDYIKDLAKLYQWIDQDSRFRELYFEKATGSFRERISDNLLAKIALLSDYFVYNSINYYNISKDRDEGCWASILNYEVDREIKSKYYPNNISCSMKEAISFDVPVYGTCCTANFTQSEYDAYMSLQY